MEWGQGGDGWNYVQCDSGCGFLAGTTVSHLVDLPSVPALEIPAQCFPPCLSVTAEVSGQRGINYCKNAE